MDMVCKCGGKKFFTEKHGNQIGLYCSACGKWQKWLNKDEIRIFTHDVPDGWIRVKDNLPDTVKSVMIYTKWGSVRRGWYSPELQVWFNMYGTTIKSVTHWRELPDPPRTEGEI